MQAGLGKGVVIHEYEFKMPPIDVSAASLVDWMRLMKARGGKAAREL